MPMSAQKQGLRMMDALMADEASEDPLIDLRIECEDWSSVPLSMPLEKLVDRAISQASRLTQSGNIDLLFTDDSAMQALNRDWREKDKPTDVLSFPSDDESFTTGFLGDIALGYGVCSHDWRSMNRTPDAHISHLLVHGYLHLLGFDHLEETEAEEMEALEVKILAELGYNDPYVLSETT